MMSKLTVIRLPSTLGSAIVAMLLVAFTPLNANAVAGSTVAVQVASRGKAVLPIVVSRRASENTRRSAIALAAQLERIVPGAKFRLEFGSGDVGIAVGTAQEFANIEFDVDWKRPDMYQREDYLIRTHANGVYLVGATPLAVEHAVWDLLYRLGHRQFFPGPHWEVLPTREDISLSVDAVESPDFHARRIWYGYGPAAYAKTPYEDWCARNRATSGVALSTGHAYGRIIHDLQAEFDNHPEYYALVDGKRDVRPLAKLCIGNSELRKKVVRYARQQFQRGVATDSLSMDPSDGGGWCECDQCQALGSVSDQALTLANEVAVAVNQGVSDTRRLIGMYAYNYHAPPPTLQVDRNVIISIATAYIKGGYTIDELVDGWSKQGATLGIREYYSVSVWDRDMPAMGRAADPAYLARTIPDYHAGGARFFSAESGDNWGPHGLGYYLAARMLWDVSEAGQIKQLTDDFFDRAFGAAQEPVREYFRQLDGSHQHVLIDDQLGRMYHALSDARKIAADESVQHRLDDLLLYTRYADVVNQYVNEPLGPARQQAFMAVLKHAFRMQHTEMIHMKALLRVLSRLDKSVSMPAADDESWQSDEPFTQQELEELLADGVRQYAPVEPDFESVDFGGDFVSARPLKLAKVARSGPVNGRGTQTFFTWVDQAPADIPLQVTGGLIAHYRDRGNVRIDVWKVNGTDASDPDVHVAHDRSVPPDGKTHGVSLRVNERGLHRLSVADGGDMTQVLWPPTLPVSRRSTLDNPINCTGRWTLYFYVPRDTETIGLLGGGAGRIRNPDGDVAFTFDGHKLGYYSVPVPAGTDGRLWKIEAASQAVRLLTVPPTMARSADELLLPRSVVERDQVQVPDQDPRDQ